MAIPSAVFTEMVTTTLRHTDVKIADNVSNHNALLNVMKRKNKIDTVSGGYEIQVPLEYAENGTYQRYQGYDQLDTGASDVLTSAKYEWKQVALHVTASGRELRMNNGKEAMKKLVKARVNNAKHTAANNMSVDIYSDGSLTNQVAGLANIIQTNGQGTVGGISAATYAFWRNKFKEMTGTDIAAAPTAANAASLLGDMNDLWLSTVRGADKPDLIVSTHDLYALFELGQQDKQRYASADLAEAGFESLKYKSADLVFDDNTNFGTTDELMYFLNCDYLYMVQHSDAQWSTEEEKQPVNQDAVVIPMFWMGEMCCSNRARQGVLFDAA